MRSAKTARGKTINMGALAAKNEKAKAVSNVPVNARGDIVDNRGNVKVSKEKVAAVVHSEKELIGSTEEVNLKEEEIRVDALDAYDDERLVTPQDKESLNEEPIEINRIKRQRKNKKGKVVGEYYEVEYSDGSMTEIEINE